MLSTLLSLLVSTAINTGLLKFASGPISGTSDLGWKSSFKLGGIMAIAGLVVGLLVMAIAGDGAGAAVAGIAAKPETGV